MATYTHVTGRDLQPIAQTLVDVYGAGATIHSSSPDKLIFSCSPIADKVIKLTSTASLLSAYYGDSYDSGIDDITNPVIWGGSYETNANATSYAVVAAPNTLLINTLGASSAPSKILLVGRLTNDAYAVLGCVAHASTSRHLDHFGYLTATGSGIWVAGMSMDMQTSTGKVLKQPLVIYDVTGVVPLTADGEPTAFQDLWSCSRQLGESVLYRGADYFISTSGLYDNNGRTLPNSLLIEGIEG